MDRIAIVDDRGIIRYLGTTQPAADGDPARDLLDRPLGELIRAEDAAAVPRLLAEARPGQAATATVHLRRPDGSWRAHEAIASPLPACPHRGWRVVTFRDLTDQRRIETRLHEVETEFRTLVEQVPAVVYVTTLEAPAMARYVSPYLQSLLGYPASAWQADPALWLRRLDPDDRERLLAASAEARRTGEPFSLEYRVLARDGRVVWVRDDMVLVRDAAGQPLAWQGVLVDITARKAAEAQLQEAEARYRTLVEQMPAVTYQIDVRGSRMRYISPQIETLLGYPAAAFLASATAWRAWLHPDDREQAIAATERAMAAGMPLSLAYRFIAHDGRVVWVQNDAVLVRDGDGQPLFWHGVVVDITARQRAESLLSDQARVLERIAAGTPLASILALLVRVVDAQGDGARCAIVLADDLPVAVPTSSGGAATGSADEPGGTAGDAHRPGPDADRGVYWTTPIRSGTGEVLGAVVMDLGRGSAPTQEDQRLVDLIVQLARIAIERQCTADRLTHQAFHDALTDLPNRALFEDRLSQALARAERRQQRVGILFVDLDEFKSVNDRWGHALGDRVLCGVAERLRACVRAEDSVARLGGDEFVVLVEDDRDETRAREVAGRIREQFRRPFEVDGQRMVLAPSIGITHSRPGATQLGDLVRAADLAMYATKRRQYGRHVGSRTKTGPLGSDGQRPPPEHQPSRSPVVGREGGT
ncbi:MAG TPA: diguanylate cyclase [Thermomicrobiaceae bacterium]|nr:diguanylate cyclase [Thermomicrobiaceae bacterium]